MSKTAAKANFVTGLTGAAYLYNYADKIAYILAQFYRPNSSRDLTREAKPVEIGKYIANIGIISTLIGAIGVKKQTAAMPNDWRRYMVWISWGINLVLAVMSVYYSDRDKVHRKIKKFENK